MALITFKDVGQGDSIILEWMDGEKKKIGIIDCNKKGADNPVLSHLIANGYTEIEFMILSHPHEDHYSGFLEVFDYCSGNRIRIGWFGHTSFNLGKEYWKLFELSSGAIQDLDKTLKSLPALRDEGLLGKIVHLAEYSRRVLMSGLVLDVLSPAQVEEQQYQLKAKAGSNPQGPGQAANLLSTVILITSGENKVLLMADAETMTLKRLLAEERFEHEHILIAQVPHHGSINNYHLNFWKGLAVLTERKAIISSGHHDGYKHPHLDVLNGLDGIGFSIHATNIIYGMAAFVQAHRETIVLDMVSELIDETGGDKAFSI